MRMTDMHRIMEELDCVMLRHGVDRLEIGPSEHVYHYRDDEVIVWATPWDDGVFVRVATDDGSAETFVNGSRMSWKVVANVMAAVAELVVRL